MKRLILVSVAAATLSTPAVAQIFESPDFDNSAAITQTGSDNDARINQTATGLLNGQGSAQIIQNGDSNDGRITQRRVSSASAVPGDFDNKALIDQRRDSGNARINQIYDYGNPVAAGKNEARILQVSDDAFARARQRGDGNFINIRQLNASVAPRAIVEQNGVDNRAIVRQRSFEGRVRVFQGDFSGTAGLSPETFDSRAIIRSDGDTPDILVEQFGTRHRTFVEEDGSNGDVTVRLEGDFNDTFVNQYGSNGTVQVTALDGSFDNVATVNQEVGDNNSQAFVEQSGWASDSLITQEGGSGTGNFADVTQSGLGLSFGDLTSTVLQDGDANSAIVSQASGYAQSLVEQTGTAHMATVSQ